jgi:hypothetical protein
MTRHARNAGYSLPRDGLLALAVSTLPIELLLLLALLSTHTSLQLAGRVMNPGRQLNRQISTPNTPGSCPSSRNVPFQLPPATLPRNGVVHSCTEVDSALPLLPMISKVSWLRHERLIIPQPGEQLHRPMRRHDTSPVPHVLMSPLPPSHHSPAPCMPAAESQSQTTTTGILTSSTLPLSRQFNSEPSLTVMRTMKRFSLIMRPRVNTMKSHCESTD